jgi:hypothetical protein
MAISLGQAIELTKAGQNVNMNLIGFDVNAIHSDTQYDGDHESSNFENEFQKTTSKTLLHIAIESQNVQVFHGLLDAGANANINIEGIRERKQRYRQRDVDFFTIDGWSKWGEWEETATSTTTTRELAQRIGNQEIITRLNEVLAPGLHM